MSYIKLKPKQVLFYEVTILFIVTILCVVGNFLRTQLFAYDSYAFYSYALGLIPQFDQYTPVFVILSNLPVNLFVYNVIMFLALFVSVSALYFGLKHVFGQLTSILTVLIVLAGAPIMIFDFAQLQNELFAYPLIFISFYFILKEKPWKALFFAGLACFFWLGAVVWIGTIALGLVLPFLIALILASPFIWDKLAWAFAESKGIAFNTYLWGLIDFFFLFPFIFFVFKQDNKQYWVWMAVSLVCACLSARFVILCIPFIALGIAYFVQNYALNLITVKKLVLICVFFIVCWNVALYLQHPTQKELVLVDSFVKDCKISNCVNDWAFGWWVTSKGGVTSFKAGPPGPDYNTLIKPFKALTAIELDCNFIATEGILKYYSC